VALNCVANGRLLREGPFDDLWIQPAAGDAGGAVGAALAAWHQFLGRPRPLDGNDAMAGSYLGPAFDDDRVRASLDRFGADYVRHEDGDLADRVAGLLAGGDVVGWFQGRMEFGPRALGARSILGDPRDPDMQSVMNLKIKYRESFRPFAPAVLEEKAGECFDLDRPSPYMLIVARIRDSLRREPPAGEGGLSGIDRLKLPRSTIPAVTHVDLSARVQTVDAATNPRFHDLLSAFAAHTGCPVLINTSFNVRGEPIVCTPDDAYRCFMRTDMDWLVIGNFVLDKRRQPPWREDPRWRDSLVAD
jgi:carbamoyltransferase